MREKRWRDSRVVVDDLALGESSGRIEDLVQVRKTEVSAFDIHDW
jgi:hypothetical protein